MPDNMSFRLNLGLANFGESAPVGGWRSLLDLAESADQAGIDAITVVDHVVLGGDLASYPFGAFPGGVGGTWLEPLTVLAAMAARTTRIRLATGILIAPLRPAAVLAKMVATLDVLSDGRADLGVGTGWLKTEYDAVGLDFSQRGALLDQTLAVMSALWAGATSFNSPSLSFDDVHVHPQPIQSGGVPVWIGGAIHQRSLRRMVEFGNGWLPNPPTSIDEVRAGVTRISAALESVGRDPVTFRISSRVTPVRDRHGRIDAKRCFDDVPALLDAGATDIYLPLGRLLPDDRPADEILDELVLAFRASAR